MNEPAAINRFAVILLPTQACCDWIKSCVGDDDNLTLDELRREPTVYLIPEGRGKPETYIRHHFKAMFEAELGSCYNDRTQWSKVVIRFHHNLLSGGLLCKRKLNCRKYSQYGTNMSFFPSSI